MNGSKTKFVPEHASYTDDDQTKLYIDIEIPGVRKEDINFKINEDSFYLSALRDDAEYVLSHSFSSPVKQEESKAKYENGLLKIEVPFRDILEDAVSVKIE